MTIGEMTTATMNEARLELVSVRGNKPGRCNVAEVRVLQRATSSVAHFQRNVMNVDRTVKVLYSILVKMTHEVDSAGTRFVWYRRACIA